jgi:hypothetical protein
MADTFRVVIFFPDEFWHEEANGLSAEEAIKLAYRITQRPAVALGIIARIIVTDPDDYCVFEWKHGQGVTFPTREQINEGR